MSLFGAKRVLGLDIGTSSIKMVELELGKQSKIANYGIIENANHLTQPSRVLQSSAHGMIVDNVAELIHQLVSKARFSGDEVYATYPIFSSFATLLDFPVLSKEEVDRAIAYSFRQYVPLSPDDAAYEWIEAGEKETSQGVGASSAVKKLFFLTAISKKIVQGYEDAVARVGLKLKSIESETLSLLRLLRLMGGIQDKTIAVLDVGAYSTNIMVIRNGYVVVNKGLDSGGGDITRSVARGLGVDGSRAELIKKTQGLTYSAEQAAVYQLVYFALDFILEEARRVFGTYSSKFSEPIDEVILVGGSSLLKGIEGYLTDKLKLKTTVFSLSQIPVVRSDARFVIQQASPELAVGIGAVLKVQELQ